MFISIFLFLFLLLREAKAKFVLTTDIPVQFSNVTHFIFEEPHEHLSLLQDYGTHILLGGRNRAYNISLYDWISGHVPRTTFYEWSTNAVDRHECHQKSSLPDVCDNYIRAFYPLPDEKRFVLCGTNGLKPMCDFFEYGKLNRKYTPYPGHGLVPFDYKIEAPFLYTRDHLYAANAPDMANSNQVFLRQRPGNLTAAPYELHTPRWESRFEGAHFVGIHRNNLEVLAFFSEAPAINDNSDTRSLASVGRVCIDDAGGSRQFEQEWMSFAKARLECRLVETDRNTLLFNQLLSVWPSTNGFYGVFRSPLAQVNATAVCFFRKKIISDIMARVFASNAKCPKAETQIEHQRLRSNPLINKKIESSPEIGNFESDRFEKILVLDDVKNMYNRSYKIMFIYTIKGSILKAIRENRNSSQPESNWKHVATYQILPADTPIISMTMTKVDTAENYGKVESHIVIVTKNSIYRVPWSNCSAAVTCQQCVGMKDPDCAWKIGVGCISREANMNLPPSSNLYHQRECTYDTLAAPIMDSIKHDMRPVTKVPCLCEQCKNNCTAEVNKIEIIYHSTTSIIFAFCAGLLIGAFVMLAMPLVIKKCTKEKSTSSSSSPAISYKSSDLINGYGQNAMITSTSSRSTYC